jgi:DNA-binding sugar fermentation-stimulating protein
MPSPTKVVPDARTKAARRGKKHKPELQELLENGESR